jgi:hypothetical protein
MSVATGRTLFIFPLIFTTAASHADEAAGAACAKGLSPAALELYEAVKPEVTAKSDLRELLRSHLRPMVIAGKLTREEAQPLAEAAGACLQDLRR